MLSNSLMVVCWYNTNEPLFLGKNSGCPKRVSDHLPKAVG